MALANKTPSLPGQRRSGLTLSRRQARLAWLMLIPAIAVLLLVALYPLGQTVYESFTDQQFLAGITPTQWVGFQNYHDLIFNDPDFRNAIWETLKFTFFSVVIEFVLGLVIALVVASNFKGRGALRTAMLIPWAIPTVVSAQMWKWMLDDVFGVINDVLQRLHIVSRGVAWISQPSTALPSVVAVDVWKTTPFVALLLLAGLQVIPGDIYEAAEVDGASVFQRFWTITLPLLRPAIMVTLVFRTMDALRVFDIFYVFFGSRPDTQTMSIYIQNTIVASGDVGYGAALSVAVFVIIAAFVVVYTTFLNVEQQ